MDSRKDEEIGLGALINYLGLASILDILRSDLLRTQVFVIGQSSNAKINVFSWSGKPLELFGVLFAGLEHAPRVVEMAFSCFILIYCPTGSLHRDRTYENETHH